jgi:hypothetical protein
MYDDDEILVNYSLFLFHMGFNQRGKLGVCHLCIELEDVPGKIFVRQSQIQTCI